jgi:hypothetical protein
VTRTGAKRPLVVGDRLDTDIAGARRAGIPSMVVLTGVTTLRALATAAPEQRPNLVAADLGGLNQPHPTALDGRCGDAVAEYDPQARRIVLRSDGRSDERLGALVTAGWKAVDDGLEVVDIDSWST